MDVAGILQARRRAVSKCRRGRRRKCDAPVARQHVLRPEERGVVAVLAVEDGDLGESAVGGSSDLASSGDKRQGEAHNADLDEDGELPRVLNLADVADGVDVSEPESEHVPVASRQKSHKERMKERTACWGC